MGSASRRLFLAFWPTPAQQRCWAGLVPESVTGRRIPAVNLHLTAAFLGELDSRRQQVLISALDGLVLPSVELVLNRLGWWRRSRILWLGPVCNPLEMQAFIDDLRQRLWQAEFSVDRRAFHPHITLARKCQRPQLPASIEPLSWTPNRLYLVQSERPPEGVFYRRLQDWS